MKRNFIKQHTLAIASLLLCAVFTSCKDKIPQKPFYIIGKDGSDYLTTTYKCIDKNKIVFEFSEQSTFSTRNVGDTIK